MVNQNIPQKQTFMQKHGKKIAVGIGGAVGGLAGVAIANATGNQSPKAGKLGAIIGAGSVNLYNKMKEAKKNRSLLQELKLIQEKLTY
jgi:hypothetical protein